jgi:sialate O-acetylesterase
MLSRATKGFSFRLTFCISFIFSAFSRADVKLPLLISDNMVLQQKARATVWGEASPGEKITVKIGEFTQLTSAGKDGRWLVKLPALKAGGSYEMSISGKNKITIHNVLAGEVWVCSGQSNMQWHVSEAGDAQNEIAAANYPEIRMFTVAKKSSDKPESDCQGKWEICSPQTVGNFSAAGYYFGRELHQALKYPIGLINSSSGSTTAEEWIPADALEKEANLKTIAREESNEMAMAREEYKRRFAEWFAASEQAKANNQPPPPEPTPPKVAKESHPPSLLFNGMISPLLHYSIRGVVWYQGESNTRNATLYRKLFPVLIGSWRKFWGESDFPFLFVQLPNFLLRKSSPAESSWAELREAQLMASKIPKTSMVVTIDIGEEHNLHPPNKQELGRRLALAARANVYGEEVAWSGPVFSTHKIEGDKVVLTFKQLNGGLVIKNGDVLKGFAIAGADKKFVWADAKIEDDKVVAHSNEVPNPVSVRYAWADNPDCNLYNKAGLPASPFRLDDW